MQVINFVPDDYLRKKVSRHANLLCGLLAAAFLVALAAVFVLLNSAQETVRTEQQDLGVMVAAASENVDKWKKFQADRQALMDHAEKAAKLLDPLPRSRVLAEVVRALPDKTTLTEFSIDEQTVHRLESAVAGAAGKSSRRGSAVQPVEKTATETRLRLLGLAPTDVEVARLIAKLSNSPYFSQVELSFSEDQVQNDHVLRRFEVLLRLSDDACRLGLESRKKEEGRT